MSDVSATITWAAGVTTLSPNTAAIWTGIGLAGLGVLGVFILAATAAARWNEDRATPFRVQHNPSCAECVEDGSNGIRILRFEVTNGGSTGVQRVRCYMQVLAGIARSHYLHLEHDNSLEYAPSRTGESLSIGQTVHFDIGAIAPDTTFTFYYADQGLTNLMANTPNDDWTFRLSVSGWTDFRDVVQAHEEFRLTINRTAQEMDERIMLRSGEG